MGENGENVKNSDLFSGNASDKFLTENGISRKFDENNRLIVDVPSVGAAFKTYIDTPQLKQKRNRDSADERKENTADAVRFTGCRHESILDAANGKVNLTPFLEGRKSLSAKLAKIPEISTLAAPKRQRRLSEHDGDIDFDRLFDRQPFNATIRQLNGAVRSVELIVDFSINCGISAEQINEYGVVAWSILDFLETNGYSVAVTFKIGTRGPICDDKRYANQTLFLKIKKSGEYCDPLALARAFTAGFYRRVIFNLYSIIADASGDEVSWGLGGCEYLTTHAERGRITIAPEISSETHKVQPKRLVELLKTALGIKV